MTDIKLEDFEIDKDYLTFSYSGEYTIAVRFNEESRTIEIVDPEVQGAINLKPNDVLEIPEHSFIRVVRMGTSHYFSIRKIKSF